MNTAPSRLRDAAWEHAPPRAAAAPEMPSPRVDVILKRETATVSLPLDAAHEQEGLIGRLGQALTGADPAPEKFSQAPLASLTSASEPSAHDARVDGDMEVLALLERLDDDASTDPSTDDAASIASRLRPAVGRA